MMKYLIFILGIFYIHEIYSQDSYNLRFDLDEINYNDYRVCYDIELQSSTSNTWSLSGQNWRIYYDNEIFSLELDSLVSYLPTNIYSSLELVQHLENIDASMVNGLLDYEDNLGFLNFFIDQSDLNAAGITVGVANDWTKIAQLCFLVDISTQDSVCFNMDYAFQEVTGDYAFAFIEISSWIGPSQTESVDRNSFTNISSDNEGISCFDFIENTLYACGDGVDNDEDGLIDCEDFSCQEYCENNSVTCHDNIDNDGDGMVDCEDLECGKPQDIMIEKEDPNCVDDFSGEIEIFASGENLEYSLDGILYQEGNLFPNLSFGEYTVYIRNSVTLCEDFLEIELTEPDCTEICDDNIDNDGDGMVDCDDLECGKPQDIMIEKKNPGCVDAFNGEIEIDATGVNLEYSLDGNVYQTSPVFLNLTYTSYTIYIRNSITLCQEIEQVELEEPDCVEICGDGLDNDGDGMIDCEDDDCETPSIIEIIVLESSCEIQNDGNIEIIAMGSDLSYRINSEPYQAANVFTNLLAGEYTIGVKSDNSGCEIMVNQQLNQLFCNEICNDGVDNDNDGYIDCDDSNCYSDAYCKFNSQDLIVPNIFSPNNKDGVNDGFYFYVNASKVEAVEYWAIFDRWGGKVYENFSGVNGDFRSEIWNGLSFNNKSLSQGVYHIMVKYSRKGEFKTSAMFSITVL